MGFLEPLALSLLVSAPGAHAATKPAAKAAASKPAVKGGLLSGKKIESTLKFFNWGQYVNPENVKAYSAKTGVQFDESNFTSNEQLLTKLNTTKALEQIQKGDTSGLLKYLEPDYALRALSDWAKEKFNIDVTPAELVTAIVTEGGVVRPPFGRNLPAAREDST